MQLQEAAKSFFLTELTSSNGSLPALELLWLHGAGFEVGSIDERWKALAVAWESPLRDSWDIRAAVVSGDLTEPE